MNRKFPVVNIFNEKKIHDKMLFEWPLLLSLLSDLDILISLRCISKDFSLPSICSSLHGRISFLT